MADSDFSPDAYFDCLFIAVRAPRSIAPLALEELHLFSYLACLLSLFRGRPASEWGYSFALTSRGYPYSPAFDIAREALSTKGYVHLSVDDTIAPNSRATEELHQLSVLSGFADRGQWLSGALDCALALPVGSIRYAVTARQDLLLASGTGRSFALVTDSYVDRVHEEHKLISQALGGLSADLLAPAVAWLSFYLLQGEKVPA